MSVNAGTVKTLFRAFAVHGGGTVVTIAPMRSRIVAKAIARSSPWRQPAPLEKTQRKSVHVPDISVGSLVLVMRGIEESKSSHSRP